SCFDASEFPIRVACDVKDFEVAEFVDAKAARRMDRGSHLLLGAARQAERDSGLKLARVGERAGAASGTALGGIASFERAVLHLASRGPERVSPFSIVQTLPNLAAGWVSCWRSSSMPARATLASMRKLPVTVSPPTRTTSPIRTRSAQTSHARCGWL